MKRRRLLSARCELIDYIIIYLSLFAKEMDFPSLQDSLQAQWDGLNGLTERQLRRTPPTYFIARSQCYFL